MKFRIVCTAAAFGIAAPSYADSSWIGVNALAGAQAPGWFIVPGGEVGVQRLPAWNSTNSLHSPSTLGAPAVSLFAPEPRLFGGEYGGTLGYAFRDDALSAGLGHNLRVGLTGTYVSMHDSQSASRTLTSTAVGVIDLQGRTVFAVNLLGAGINPGISESLRVHRTGFDLNMRVASDYSLAPDWTLTASVAIVGGRTIDAYNFDSRYVSAGVTSVANQIDEKVRTWSLGGDISAGLTWQATSTFSLNLTGRAGVVWQHSQLDGTQCVVFTVVNCSTALFIPGTVSNTAVSESRSRAGFRGGAALNVGLDFPIGRLTLGGFFLYDSAVPGVQNPSQATLLAPGSSTGQTARIHFDGVFRYGGVVALRVPLIGM